MRKSTVSAMIKAQKTAKYNATVRDFVRDSRGRFIVVTDDQLFLTLLYNLVRGSVGAEASDNVRAVLDAGVALKVVNEAEKVDRRPFLLIERRMRGQDMGHLIRQLKVAYPTMPVMVLTSETDRHRIMYLHEIGADNFVIKPVSAQTLLEKLAATIKPQDALGLLIEEAREAIRNGDPQRGKELALDVLEIKPGSPAGLMVLGDAQLALGEADAAREAFAQASLNADLYLEPLRRLASLAENEGDFEQCLEYLDRLDQLSPLNIDRKIDMGRINLELGNDVKAERLFGSALEQVSRDAMGQVGNLAERIAAVYSERDPGKAESFLRRALNAKRNYLTRDDLRLFNQLGVNLRRQGKWRDAVAEYRRALAIAADEVTIHYNMGMAYSEGGMHRDAKLCMDKALSLDEKLALVSPNVACNLGMVYLRGGLRDRARRFFEDALDQNPDMERAHKALESM